jgi:hypothetical protein
MSINLPARRRQLRGDVLATREERQAAKLINAIDSELLVRRATDIARRDLANGRMSDIGTLTDHALSEGGHIAGRLAAEAENHPHAIQTLSELAEAGIRGLRRELGGFTED